MTTKIIMPQAGQDITEGLVVRWLKREGESIRKGEVLCEVETEKAVFEVESPVDGVLLKIVAREGERVPIYTTIGIVGAPGEKAELDPLPAKEKKTGPGIDVAAIRKRLEAGAQERDQAKASGRARKLAIDQGIDVSQVQGSGPRGRVTEKDLLIHVEKRRMPGPALRGRVVPLTGIRQTIARRMSRSKQTIPHFYVTVSVDVGAALALQDRLNPSPGSGISITDLIVKASALALKAHPQTNCRIQEDRIIFLDDINIGVAVTLENGVAVPVLPGVDQLPLGELSRLRRELTGLAKAGRQANLEPACFTVSNLGMLNVDNFIAIINPPETAILAVGSIQKRPVVGAGGELVIRDMLTMTLSIDHRAVDGALAARFINTIKDCLEDPQTLVSGG
jgi:pyruvate dehydrogenase E2 component (dihydrolipoyllysine-residue acetyltransferase)